MKMIIGAVALGVILCFAQPLLAQKSAAGLLKQCEASSERGDYAGAIVLCTKAIQLNPVFEEAYLTRALIYKRQGDLESAIADQTKLIDLTGFTQFLVYRAELYLLQNKADLALADLDRAIANKPTGIYGARAYHFRGTIFESRANTPGAIADYEAALRLRPSYSEAAERLAKLKPPVTQSPPILPSPIPPIIGVTPTPQPPAAQASPTPMPVVSGWKRMELTGTGLSVESPEPFQLKQDKPDPFIKTETARIFWTLSRGGIFVTVTYVKTTDGKTPQQALEAMAKFVAESNMNPIATVVDATFAGQRAVQFDEEFVDTYDPDRSKKKRRVAAYGSAGEIITVHMSYPAADASQADMAEQIFRSFQKKGAVAASTPMMPAADWRNVTFHGLRFETPNPVSQPSCGYKLPLSILLAESDEVCYEWDRSPILKVDYERYRRQASVPAVTQLAQRLIEGRKEVQKDSTLNERVEYSTESVAIAGADAIKVKIFTSFGTVATREETIIIKRGAELWKIRTSEAVRWQYTTDAVKRIAASIKF